MKIYRLDTPSDKNGNPIFKHMCFDGKRSPTNWLMSQGNDRDAARAAYIPPEWFWCGNKRWRVSDHPDGAVPGEIFSQKSMDTLMNLVDIERGDIYDLGHGKSNDKDVHYWLYILWNRINVVDMPIPAVVVGQLQSPVSFKKDIGKLPHIFKSYHENRAWVTEDFKAAVESAGLTGFMFTPIGDM